MRLFIIFCCIITTIWATPLLRRSLLGKKIKQGVIELTAGISSGDGLIQGTHSIGIAKSSGNKHHTEYPSYGGRGQSVATASAGNLYNSQAHSSGLGHSGHKVNFNGGIGNCPNCGNEAVASSSSLAHSSGSQWSNEGYLSVGVGNHHVPIAQVGSSGTQSGQSGHKTHSYGGIGNCLNCGNEYAQGQNVALAGAAASSSSAAHSLGSQWPNGGHLNVGVGNHHVPIAQVGPSVTQSAHSGHNTHGYGGIGNCPNCANEYSQVQNVALTEAAATSSSAAATSSSAAHSSGSHWSNEGHLSVGVNNHHVPIAQVGSSGIQSGQSGHKTHSYGLIGNCPNCGNEYAQGQNVALAEAAASSSSAGHSSGSQWPNGGHPNVGVSNHHVPIAQVGSSGIQSGQSGHKTHSFGGIGNCPNCGNEYAQGQNVALAEAAASSSSTAHSSESQWANQGHINGAPGFGPASASASGWNANGAQSTHNAYSPPTYGGSMLSNSAAASSASSSAASSWNQQNVNPVRAHGHSGSVSHSSSTSWSSSCSSQPC